MVSSLSAGRTQARPTGDLCPMAERKVERLDPGRGTLVKKLESGRMPLEGEAGQVIVHRLNHRIHRWHGR
jgi:hypothetical protein